MTTTPPNVTTLLSDTLDVFDGGAKWYKGSYHYRGLHCLVGGVEHAYTIVVGGETLTSVYGSTVRERSLAVLAEVVRDLYPDRDGDFIDDDESQVIAFNDHTETTWVDVERVLNEAHRRSQVDD